MPNTELSSLEITEMLRAWSSGRSKEADRLFPLVYDELRQQAHRFLRRERPEHTLQTTALINEAYIKLRQQRNFEWESRAHFFAICARLMRRILVDYAKTRYRAKRGGQAIQLTYDETVFAADESKVDIVALDDALSRLEVIDTQQAQVVELRYFSGFSLEETAEVLGVSVSTVKRDWRMAKAWLHQELSPEETK